MRKSRAIDELKIISFAKRMLPRGEGVILGIGDDAAALKIAPGRILVATTDMIVEGVHFKSGEGLEKIGRKALAVNISDIAAMAAVPKFALISIGLPADYTMAQAEAVLRGIKDLARQFKVSIVGGDTTQSRILVVNITLLGEAMPGEIIRRDQAKPGDLICVTGELGGSIKGKHLTFLPRVKEARFLAKNFPINSMIDISDGLVLDLYRICASSQCRAILFKDLVPLSKAADSLADGLYSGEDFELLFTCPEKIAHKLRRDFMRKFKTNLSIIGKIYPSPKPGIKFLDKSGDLTDAKIKGYVHFGEHRAQSRG